MSRPVMVGLSVTLNLRAIAVPLIGNGLDVPSLIQSRLALHVLNWICPTRDLVDRWTPKKFSHRQRQG
jgi:hypothetical protein